MKDLIEKVAGHTETVYVHSAWIVQADYQARAERAWQDYVEDLA